MPVVAVFPKSDPPVPKAGVAPKALPACVVGVCPKLKLIATLLKRLTKCDEDEKQKEDMEKKNENDWREKRKRENKPCQQNM